jgi:hypothetical protein
MSDRGDATELYQTNDLIALALGRLAAQRLAPDRLRAFQRTIQLARERAGDNKYRRMWEEIIMRGSDAVAEALTETTERGQVLRSVISFRAFVTKDERDAIFREHTRREAARQRR